MTHDNATAPPRYPDVPVNDPDAGLAEGRGADGCGAGEAPLCEWGVDWKELAILRAAEVAQLSAELERAEARAGSPEKFRAALASLAAHSPLAGMTDETLWQIAGSHAPSAGAARALLEARVLLGEEREGAA